jgi:hypothetical protein
MIIKIQPSIMVQKNIKYIMTPDKIQQKNTFKKYIEIFIVLNVLSNNVCAQPYLDIISVKYSVSPDAGLLNRNHVQNNFKLLNAAFNIPILLKKDSSIIMFGPFAERWKIKTGNSNEIISDYYSLGLPVYFIKPVNRKWSISIAAIVRSNGHYASLFQNKLQIGGLFLNSFKKSENLTWKIGLYYNKEFFGNFIMPLAGIDWKIDKKNSLFGVLPGNMIFEHRVTNKLYYGASFKAVTNSYMSGYINNGSIPMYIRIDDNQLGLFADYYFAKNTVLNLEVGHSFFRRIRLGRYGVKQNYFLTEKMNDNLFIKFGLTYRIRFRNR